MKNNVVDVYEFNNFNVELLSDDYFYFYDYHGNLLAKLKPKNVKRYSKFLEDEYENVDETVYSFIFSSKHLK